MLTFAFEEVIDANADDILIFLERNSRSEHTCKQQPDGVERTVSFDVERTGNIVSVYLKPCPSNPEVDELIRFEVRQHTKTMALVKAFYEPSNPHFILMFYRIWARFAIAFHTRFAGEVLRKLAEAEKRENPDKSNPIS